MAPIVYVETNWLIALLFPHDGHHERAMELFGRMNSGECELRIPRIAFIEAQWTMVSTNTELQESIAKLKDVFLRGFRNGVDDLQEGEAALVSPAVKRYLQRNLRPLLDGLLSNPDVHQFSDPAEEIDAIGALRSELRLRATDVKDLYVFTAILVDRAKQDPVRPAIFMSTNKNEFKPGPTSKAKVPEWVYEKNRLLFRESFDALPTAVGHWKAQFS
jgi:predicted nucleic acid-binding protein